MTPLRADERKAETNKTSRTIPCRKGDKSMKNEKQEEDRFTYKCMYGQRDGQRD